MQEGAGPRPFDVTTRHLIEHDPVSWLRWIGLPVDAPVHAVESEVSTVLAEVDKVLRVDAPSPWYAHLEVQTGRDPQLPSRMLQYHVLLRHRHQAPVESTVVLLAPGADGPELSGLLEQHGIAGNQTIAFWFRVVRLWERPVDEILHGGLGILPLAPLANVDRSRVPEVVRQLDERFRNEASPTIAGELWSATLLLLGLRYDATEARQLMPGDARMRESSTYQAILEEGREEGRITTARQLVFDLGTSKYGPPDAATVATLKRLNDPDALHTLALEILGKATWEDLLGTAT